MERGISHLSMAAPTKRVPDFESTDTDPYQMIQVHDYLSISFLIPDANVKACANAATALFQSYYPELLSKKFFINVPVVLGWVYKVMTMTVARATQKKFVVLSYGNTLNTELGKDIPKEYGGEKDDLKAWGETMNLETPATAATPATKEAKV